MDDPIEWLKRRVSDVTADSEELRDGFRAKVPEVPETATVTEKGYALTAAGRDVAQVFIGPTSSSPATSRTCRSIGTTSTHRSSAASTRSTSSAAEDGSPSQGARALCPGHQTREVGMIALFQGDPYRSPSRASNGAPRSGCCSGSPGGRRRHELPARRGHQRERRGPGDPTYDFTIDWRYVPEKDAFFDLDVIRVQETQLDPDG